MPRKVQKNKNSQIPVFPVPISSFEKKEANSWRYYIGDIQLLNVVVKASGDADALYKMGSFGQWTSSGIETNDINNMLILTFEEAFFLSYALGCLFIHKGDENINILDQWKLFCSLKNRFPVTYAVYHHFRTKGRVPKDGLKFGSDFILYEHGPSFTHAAYAVVIKRVNDDLTDSEESSRTMTWTSMAGLARLVSSVSKSLLICSITCMNIDASTPDCLKQMSIHETVFARWMSSKEQEEEERDVDTVF